MWIIFVFILALGAGTMTYRAATGYRTEPREPSAVKTRVSQSEMIPVAGSVPPFDKASAPIPISGKNNGGRGVANKR